MMRVLQVEIEGDLKKLLTINTHRVLFPFNRLASGVKSAPGAFQQVTNSLIAGIEEVESFLDGFIIPTETEVDHDRTLNAIFSHLQEFGFNFRLEEYNFAPQAPSSLIAL